MTPGLPYYSNSHGLGTRMQHLADQMLLDGLSAQEAGSSFRGKPEISESFLLTHVEIDAVPLIWQF